MLNKYNKYWFLTSTGGRNIYLTLTLVQGLPMVEHSENADKLGISADRIGFCLLEFNIISILCLLKVECNFNGKLK